MLNVWRICFNKHARRAFSGEGARLYGGRWNKPGLPVVYTAGSLSLAALESLVHFEVEDAPGSWVFLSAQIPTRLKVSDLKLIDLPRDWRRYPAPISIQELGSIWLLTKRLAVLRVPSALIPGEHNYLLNPLHPEFSRIQIHPPKQFSFDPRLRNASS